MAGSRNKPFTEGVRQAVVDCLTRHVRKTQSVVVGFSGGLDSTVLLHAASGLVKEVDCHLSALHVHHGLSRNADAWADSCALVCEELGVPFKMLRVDVLRTCGEGTEAAARNARHGAISAFPADWILLAHHADDQAETVLHHLLRGAGVRGAAAIPELRGRVLRPLLGLTRPVLLQYALDHRLMWVEDESNGDTRFTRNFLRKNVIPIITERFPKAKEKLAAAAARFSEANSLLDDLASMDLRGNPAQFPLPLNVFRELPDPRARNLLRALLAWHHVQPPDERRLNEFVRQLQSAGNDRHPRIDLARYSLWCDAGKLNFQATD